MLQNKVNYWSNSLNKKFSRLTIAFTTEDKMYINLSSLLSSVDKGRITELQHKEDLYRLFEMTILHKFIDWLKSNLYISMSCHLNRNRDIIYAFFPGNIIE